MLNMYPLNNCPMASMLQLLQLVEIVMKNQSYFTNSRGFILPSIILIILLLLIVFTTSILIYKQEMFIAKNHMEQLKIESLIHLGIESYKEDLKVSEYFIDKQIYSFSQGDVTISATEGLAGDRIIIDL